MFAFPFNSKLKNSREGFWQVTYPGEWDTLQYGGKLPLCHFCDLIFQGEKGDNDWQPQRLHGQRKRRCGCLRQRVFLRTSFPSPSPQLHSLGWYISDSSGASFPSIPLPIYILVSSGPIHLAPSYSTMKEHMEERMNFCWVVAMYFVSLTSLVLMTNKWNDSDDPSFREERKLIYL